MKRAPRRFAALLIGLVGMVSMTGGAAEALGQTSSKTASASSEAAEDSRSTAARVAARVRARKMRAAKQASYGFERPGSAQTAFLPRHLRSPGSLTYRGGEAEIISSGTVVQGDMPPGDIEYEVTGDPIPEEMYAGESCGGAGCGSCGQCLIPCPVISLDNVEIWGGAHGFTGPANRGETGSFGFQYGLNWAAPMPCLPCGDISVQAGFNGIHSNFSGAEFTEEERSQFFVTLGGFRRVDWGLQGGLVVDYLSDEWYHNVDLMQLRGELSWVYPCYHELGFWFTTGLSEDTSVSNLLDNTRTPFTETTTWEANDLFAFFYRRRFKNCNGGEGRLFAGWTGDSDGLLGADIRLPIDERLALQAEFTYLIPENSESVFGHREEAWNVSINLVWYPGCRGSRSGDYGRPLFNVANNGSFILQPQTPQ